MQASYFYASLMQKATERSEQIQMEFWGHYWSGRGTGKPERLKHFKNRAIYSRRISDEHRLIYDLKNDRLRILGCKGHYKKDYAD